jgi:hypothetical protein
MTTVGPSATSSLGLKRSAYSGNSVEKVENTAKTKFSQKLAGGGFLLRMRSYAKKKGRRKLPRGLYPEIRSGRADFIFSSKLSPSAADPKSVPPWRCR